MRRDGAGGGEEFGSDTAGSRGSSEEGAQSSADASTCCSEMCTTLGKSPFRQGTPLPRL